MANERFGRGYKVDYILSNECSAFCFSTKILLTLDTFRYLLVIEPLFHSSGRSAWGRRPVRLPAEEAGQGSEVLRLRGLSDGQAGRPHGQRLAVSSSSSINSCLHVHFQAPSPCWPSPPARSTPPPTVCPPGRVQSSKVRISTFKLQPLDFDELETLLKKF